MGDWKKVVYKQVQPIYIGYKSHGIINETRVFIPGITMWGALTNAFGKENNWDKDKYEQNKAYFENITCFYPMIDNAVLYPRFKNGEFYLGFCNEKEFRYEYIDTYISTAINPATLNAKDKSLHEIDIILPQGKEDKKQLYWVGYVKTNKEIPNEVYVGGDSRYGLGLMRLEGKPKDENYPYEVIKGIYQDSYPKNEPISNFVEFKNQSIEGKLEILAEFEYGKISREIKDAKFYITPGSKINEYYTNSN